MTGKSRLIKKDVHAMVSTHTQLHTVRPGLRLFHADASALLESLEAGSVDLILTDPPYYRVKEDDWDRQWATDAEFLAWMGELCDGWRRVLKPNGSLYVFASPEMAGRVECVVRERFQVLNSIRWVKDKGWHQKTDEETLRSYLSPWEAVIFAEPDLTTTVDYLLQECANAGLTPEQVSGLLGFAETAGSIAPRRYLRADGFAPMRREHYALLQQRTGYFQRPYDDLYRQFAAPPDCYTDVWEFPTVQAYPGKHPCEKPQELLRHIITTSSRPGATVLDCFMGSGSTGEAALALGREFIGGDASSHWSQYACARLERRFGALPPTNAHKKPKRQPATSQGLFDALALATE